MVSDGEMEMLRWLHGRMTAMDGPLMRDDAVVCVLYWVSPQDPIDLDH